jgi:hypothetical protein
MRLAVGTPDLERLRFLLAGLREPAPSKEAERRAVEAFGRLWRCRSGQDRRSGEDRRHRAVLVETDRRAGLDRRTGDRRKD